MQGNAGKNALQKCSSRERQRQLAGDTVELPRAAGMDFDRMERQIELHSLTRHDLMIYSEV